MIRNIDTKLSTFVVALGLAALCGCSDEFGNGWGSKGNTTLTATIDQAGVQSRTCIDPTSYDGGVVGLLWTPDDCLGVFGDANTRNSSFANRSTTNVSQASFSGNLNDGELPKYAYYPYSEANNGKEPTNLIGKVSDEQTFDLGTGQLTDDWKYGTLKRTTSAGYEFQMNHLFAMAKVTVNATGSALQGDSLQSVSVTVTPGEGTDVRRINGDFTFSAEDGTYLLTGTASEGSNTTNMVWSDKPSLTSGKSYTGYLTLIPDVKKGDKFTICLTTDKHTATYEVKSKVNFQKGSIYNFPLNLTYLAETMMNDYQKEPTITEIPTEPGTDPEPTVTTGTFTACAFNVDGLPDINYIIGSTNPDGPGSSGTTEMAKIANDLGWDIIAASEDFEYHSQLASGLSNYNAGTYRGTVTSAQATKRADTDGLCFFWKKGLTVTSEGKSPGSNGWEKMVQYNDEEGGLTGGANTCIKKGFRHYEVEVSEGVIVDVYITHMNTYSGSGNTESNAYVKAVLSQLRQLRDYVLEKAKANKRPAIIMGDTNMRYTRHDIKKNFLDVVAAYDNNAGYTVSDPWVEFHRGGVYPQWNSLSLMTRFAFAGDKTNDIVCADNQCGEVVDKIWYINVPGAEVQLKATAHKNDVDNFRKSTSNVSYSGVMVEDANGSNTSGNTKYTSGQTVSYTKDVGYSDHFPVVTTFEWTKTVSATK